MGLLGGLRRPSPEVAAKLQIEERELERAGFVWGGAGSAGRPPRGKNGEQHQQAADPARLRFATRQLHPLACRAVG